MGIPPCLKTLAVYNPISLKTRVGEHANPSLYFRVRSAYPSHVKKVKGRVPTRLSIARWGWASLSRLKAEGTMSTYSSIEKLGIGIPYILRWWR